MSAFSKLIYANYIYSAITTAVFFTFYNLLLLFFNILGWKGTKCDKERKLLFRELCSSNTKRINIFGAVYFISLFHDPLYPSFEQLAKIKKQTLGYPRFLNICCESGFIPQTADFIIRSE